MKWADLTATTGHFSWPPVGSYVTAYGHSSMAADSPFYQPLRPGSGEAPPVALSRHVTVHHADRVHYTKTNATIAVLLATSVLRGLQEYR